MDECAACGATVDGYATYCDACGDGDGDGDGDDSGHARPHDRTHRPEEASFDVPSPVARGVGALLASAVLLGGFTTFQSLQYLPEALSYYEPVDTVGFFANQLLTVASVASGVVVTATPDTITRWLPTFVDPAYVVLNVVLVYTYPDVFARDLGFLALGILGATVTFTAGARLRRT